MARPNQETIDTFMSITGSTEAVAIQRLEEHGGDLNEAINAHFSEDRNVVQEAPAMALQNDFMDIDDPVELEPRGPPSLFSASRGLNRFSLLDPNFRSLFDSTNFLGSRSNISDHAPFVSHPREVRQIPIEVKDGNSLSGPSGHGPTIEDVTDTEQAQGSEIHGMVIMDEKEDNISTAPARGAGRNEQVDRTSHRHLVQSGPSFDDISDYGNDIEEEMIQAAIEASKKDAELQKQQDLNHDGPHQRQLHIEDCGVVHAVSFSLKTEEQEGAVGEQAGTVRASGPSDNKPVKVEGLDGKDESNGRQSVDSFHITSAQPKNVAGSSSTPYEVEELEERPLVRNRSRFLPAGSNEAHKEVEVIEVSPPPSPQHATATDTQLNGNAFHSDEWGGISSEEHDEAVMLEAAMFGGIPEQSEFHFPYAPHQFMQSGFDGTRQAPRPPSPGLAAQRLIREQQDDEYLASLQADREKELKAMEEEKAARQATLEEQQRKVEESRKKFEEEQELERQLATKEASLPEEPVVDDENAVTLLVRMPDGSRRGRRFLKTDKLESLFNFIDVGRGVKSGTYRVVRPFPRRAFSDGDSNLSLNELGLTSKQEALFLELI